MKRLLFILVMFSCTVRLNAQPGTCTFLPPAIRIHFGSGNVRDVNTTMPPNYARVASPCPTDGHYTYTSSISDCFRGDWHTLTEDHTPGDAAGNMMLVNASWNSGTFLQATLPVLKSSTTYEFAAWLMNVCRPTDKCPFPLLPNITIRLQTPAGKTVAQLSTGELVRHEKPQWKQFRMLFTTPSSATALTLIMINNAPGGCGNDFALDDITFRECVKTTPATTAKTKTTSTIKKQPPSAKDVQKKEPSAPANQQTSISQIEKPQTNAPAQPKAAIKQTPAAFPVPPLVIRTRANPLIRQIQTEASEIKIDLYDNGEIDGDTVSVYHNNTLLVGQARLSQKPISFRITVDAAHPHHELIMVAENLGSIPPNTSLMIITAGTKRYEVFISSTEQKNAKVVLDLKE